MIERNTFTIIFGIFFLLTCRDIFYGNSSQDANPEVAKPGSVHDHLHYRHSDIESGSSHPANLPGIPTVKIQYCHSCGYRQAFDEVAKMLKASYPGMLVEGELHQPNWLRSQIVNLLFLSKIAALIMIYMDINPFTYLQMETPRIWTHITQSKVSSSLIILFIANSIESSMMSTGAFEIFYNDMPLWSKIETGRMPTGPELLQAVGREYNLAENTMKSKFAGLVPT